MKKTLDALKRAEAGLVKVIAERVSAFRAKGEKIHVLGVRRSGDDDACFSIGVSVDPLQSGTSMSYEPRDDLAAVLWRLKKEGPEELRELVSALAEEHEDLDPDDLPGRSMTLPHAIFTSFADDVATALAKETDLPVVLLCTEGVPIDDGDREALRAWIRTEVK